MIRNFLAFFFGVFISLSHASDGLQRSDQAYYDEGVVLRKAGRYDQAKKCFSAAVFAQDGMPAVKALYNLGHISYLEGRIQDAALWFAQSNLAHIALTGEAFQPAVKGSQVLLQGSVLSFFSPAKELFSAPNRDIRDLFTKVIFSSIPRAISLKDSFVVKGGDLEVHFRDADHLRAIVTASPLFSGKNTYYVVDPDVEDGKEFQAVGGTGYWEKFVHVEGDEGLELKGSIPYLPFTLVLPKGAEHGGLSMRGGTFQKGLFSLDDSLRLLSYLGDISDENIRAQKEEALALLAERRLDRLTHPEKYPSLGEVSPERGLLSDGTIKESQGDYIRSGEKPFYVAPSKALMLLLIKDVPIFLNKLFFINPNLSCDGIYTATPVEVERGFTVESDKNLLTYGKFALENYNVQLISRESMWLMATNLHAKSIGIFSSGSLSILGINLPIEKMRQPKGMPDHLWNVFCQYHSQ